MPDNLAEAHLAMLRSLSGTTPTLGGSEAPAEVRSPPRADNMSSTATPVVGGGGAAELKEALDKGLRGDSRGRR